MINARFIDGTDILRRWSRIIFTETIDGQPERVLCQDGDDAPFSRGWFTWQEIDPSNTGVVDDDVQLAHTPFIITLDGEMLHALTDALLIHATGTPLNAVAMARKDLEHERARRDRLEDTVVELARNPNRT